MLTWYILLHACIFFLLTSTCSFSFHVLNPTQKWVNTIMLQLFLGKCHSTGNRSANFLCAICRHHWEGCVTLDLQKVLNKKQSPHCTKSYLRQEFILESWYIIRETTQDVGSTGKYVRVDKKTAWSTIYLTVKLSSSFYLCALNSVVCFESQTPVL